MVHQPASSSRGNKSARIVFVGDVMLGRLVSQELHRRPAEGFWGDVRPLLQDVDAVIANLECAITTSKEPWSRTPKVFHFGADPRAIDVLRAGNVRAVSLANNHVLDFETAGLLETIDLLEKAGIAHAGAGHTETEALAPAILDIGGLKLALLAVTDNEPAFAARADQPGTAYVDLDYRREAISTIETGVIASREAGADLLVLSCHLGPNMVLRPPTPIREFRHAAVAKGIDLVQGHSAHVTQGVERDGRSLILHDTGDFLDDYAVDPVLHNDWSFVFLVEVEAASLRRLTLIPVRLGFAEVRLALPHESREICARMTKLSAELGTGLVPSPDGLSLDLSPS
jgi:poly-gamma-glutamate synthesis protein (capsule biosynthesis protein)